MKFYSTEEVLIAHNEGRVDLHAKIQAKVKYENEDGTFGLKRTETTVGRVIFNQATPEKVPFINELLTKKNLRKVIMDIIERTDFPTTATFLDAIKEMGFYWSFKGGLSFNLGDLITPTQKAETLVTAQKEVDEVWDNYNMGLITNNERYNQIIDKWTLFFLTSWMDYLYWNTLSLHTVPVKVWPIRP